MAGAIGTAGISLAPILLESLIGVLGFRQVWVFEGLLIWARSSSPMMTAPVPASKGLHRDPLPVDPDREAVEQLGDGRRGGAGSG